MRVRLLLLLLLLLLPEERLPVEEDVPDEPLEALLDCPEEGGVTVPRDEPLLEDDGDVRVEGRTCTRLRVALGVVESVRRVTARLRPMDVVPDDSEVRERAVTPPLAADDASWVPVDASCLRRAVLPETVSLRLLKEPLPEEPATMGPHPPEPVRL